MLINWKRKRWETKSQRFEGASGAGRPRAPGDGKPGWPAPNHLHCATLGSPQVGRPGIHTHWLPNSSRGKG